MPHIKKKDEAVIMILAIAVEIGLWFLLRPETYRQRILTVSFGVFLLVLGELFAYFHVRYISSKPDVSN